MPINYTRYPKEWKAFSQQIRARRAEDRCECTGECGLTHPGSRRCGEVNGTAAQWAHGRIVLTVAHLCTCAPLCIDEHHVKAMCQRCHLRTDSRLHVRHAARTRLARLEAAGQQLLFREGTH